MFICLLLLRRGRRIISGPCKSPSPPLSVFSTWWHNKHGAHPQREEQSLLEPCQRVLEGNKRLRCRASEVSEGFFVSGFFCGWWGDARINGPGLCYGICFFLDATQLTRLRHSSRSILTSSITVWFGNVDTKTTADRLRSIQNHWLTPEIP